MLRHRSTQARGWALFVCLLVLVSGLQGVSDPAAAGGRDAPETTPPPNVLLVIADDQAPATFSSTTMPNVFSQLVGQGINFSRGYVNTSLCCPSRSEILTGLYESHTGVDINAADLLHPTIVDALRARGYRTALAGKYLNSWPCDARPEFDEWLCQGSGSSDPSLVNPTVNDNGVWRTVPGYTTDILADRLVSFIQSTPADQPFFAMYTPTSPHLPANDDRCQDPVAPHRPPSYDQDTQSGDHPAYMQRGPLSTSERAGLEADFASMSNAVRCLDGSIGTLLSGLGSRAQDTLVVFMSDNGYQYGEHRGWGKGVPREESVRVPFVVRYPAMVPAPSASNALVQNVDIAPTIAALVGFPWNVDGKSLVPILTGQSSTVRDSLLIQGCQGVSFPCQGLILARGRSLAPSYAGVVTATAKYVKYATGESEMYQLTTDSYEMANLTQNPAYASLKTDMESRLQALTLAGPPDTTIVDGPAEGAQLATRVIPFSFFARSRTARFQCRLDQAPGQGTWSDCSSGSTILGPLADGDYTFMVQGIEGVEVDPAPATRSFSIHTTGPDAAVTSAPPGRTTARTLDFSFSSQTPGVTFQCRIALLGVAGNWESCSGTAGYGPLADGAWLFQVQAVDGFGNRTTPPAQALVHVDNRGPVMTVRQGPASATKATTAQFDFTPNETVSDGLTCRLDGGSAQDCSSGAFSASGLPDGSHTLTISATDLVQNAGSTAISWTIDRTPPVLTLAGFQSITKSATVSFTVTSNEPLVTGDLDTLGGCALDGANLWRLCGGFVTLPGLADGVHVYSVQGVDRALNASTPADWTFTVDTTPPLTTITSGPSSPTTSRSATFVFSAPDMTTVTYNCKLDKAPAGPCASPITRNNLKVGSHKFYVQATDAAGNVGPVAKWTWTIAN